MPQLRSQEELSLGIQSHLPQLVIQNDKMWETQVQSLGWEGPLEKEMVL